MRVVLPARKGLSGTGPAGFGAQRRLAFPQVPEDLKQRRRLALLEEAARVPPGPAGAALQDVVVLLLRRSAERVEAEGVGRGGRVDRRRNSARAPRPKRSLNPSESSLQRKPLNFLLSAKRGDFRFLPLGWIDAR